MQAEDIANFLGIGHSAIWTSATIAQMVVSYKCGDFTLVLAWCGLDNLLYKRPRKYAAHGSLLAERKSPGS
jgi:hypothetical protein